MRSVQRAGGRCEPAEMGDHVRFGAFRLKSGRADGSPVTASEY